MANTGAFAIPCQIIISARTRAEAEHAALVMLREMIGSHVFDVEDDMNTVCIGFDTAEELRNPERDIS